MESNWCLLQPDSIRVLVQASVSRTKKDAVSSQLDCSETYWFFVLQGLLHVWMDLIKTHDRLTLVTRPMVRKGHVFK